MAARPSMVSVRMSRSEADAIGRAAKRAGVSRSVYMRTRSLEGLDVRDTPDARQLALRYPDLSVKGPAAARPGPRKAGKRKK